MIDKAILEKLNAEFDKIPPREELEKMYTFSERHEKQMQKIFDELRRRERIENYWRAVRKIAVIIIAILALAVVSVKFVPKVYAQIKAWLEDESDDRMSFNYDSSKGVNEEVDNVEKIRIEAGYLPEGYVLESEEISTVGNYKAVYKNDIGERLRISCCIDYYDAKSSINVEDSLLERYNINGYEYCVFKDNEGLITITWEKEDYFFKCVGVCNENELLNVSSGIRTMIR